MVTRHVELPANTTLLDDAVALRTRLLEYGGLVYLGRAREAEAARAGLSDRWSRIAADLTAAGLERTYQHEGRALPIFEPLFSPAGPYKLPPKRAMAAAITALDAVIAIAQVDGSRQVPESAPSGSGRVLIGMLVAVAVGWLLGMEVHWKSIAGAMDWLKLHAGPLHFGVSITIAIAGTLGGGLLIHLLHQHGWRGAWNSCPAKTTAYFLLLAMAVVMGLLGPIH